MLMTSSSGGYAVPVPGNGTYTVTFTAADGFTVISTQMITVAGLANAKADVTNAPAGSGAVPEINVTRSAITVADGSTDVVAGVTVGVPTAVSYVVANTGTASLTLGAVTISSLVNCTAVVSATPAASVAALASTSLEVTVTPSATTWSCSVSVVTNDTNENPMNWTMSNAAAPGGGGGGTGGSSSGGGGGGCGAGCGSAATVGFGLLLALSLSRRRQR